MIIDFHFLLPRTGHSTDERRCTTSTKYTDRPDSRKKT